jgi:hypothetical protein
LERSGSPLRKSQLSTLFTEPDHSRCFPKDDSG